jgi:hypothetical protein
MSHMGLWYRATCILPCVFCSAKLQNKFRSNFFFYLLQLEEICQCEIQIFNCFMIRSQGTNWKFPNATNK